MYVTDIEDLYGKANTYFASRGRCRSINSEDETVKLLLYGVEVFYLGMPREPWTSLTFQYEASENTRIQNLLGVRLNGIENTREDVERAFQVIDNFARLHLPDKYLEAWEMATST